MAYMAGREAFGWDGTDRLKDGKNSIPMDVYVRIFFKKQNLLSHIGWERVF